MQNVHFIKTAPVDRIQAKAAVSNYERFIVKSSSRSVILEQTLDSSSPSNFDSTVQVIREILKGETAPDVQP